MISNKKTKVHIALVLCNSIWGISSVVGAVGLSTMHPIAFLTIRQVLAGLLLLAVSGTAVNNEKSSKPKESLTSSSLLQFKQHWKLFAFTAMANFSSHFSKLLWHSDDNFDFSMILIRSSSAKLHPLGFLVGITLAGPVACSIWQACQPIFMAFIAILLGREVWNSRRMSGIAMAFCGCSIMVLLAPQSKAGNTAEVRTSQSSTLFLAGNFLFMVDCLSEAVFVLLSKKLLEVFSPVIIMGYCYLISAVYMGMATAASLMLIPMTSTPASSVWISGSMIPPLDALPALIWFVVVSAATASFLRTWATKHATGTLVLSYSVMTPASTVVLTVLLLGMRMVPNCANINTLDEFSTAFCLFLPNLGTLFGMIGVCLGLSLIIMTEPKSDKRPVVQSSSIGGTEETALGAHAAASIFQGKRMVVV